MLCWPFSFCYYCIKFIFLMLSCLFLALLWSPAGNGLTTWLSCLYFFSCIFVSFPYDVTDKVWYFIESIPDVCLSLYLDLNAKPECWRRVYYLMAVLFIQEYSRPLRIHRECEVGIKKGRPEDYQLASWGLLSDDKPWSQGTDFSIPSSHKLWSVSLAHH